MRARKAAQNAFFANFGALPGSEASYGDARHRWLRLAVAAGQGGAGVGTLWKC